MKKSIILLLLLGLALPAQAKAVNILTTTTDLKSIAEYIGGETVQVDSLGKGKQNYHFLTAKPSYMIKAKNADLFIVSGLDLEIGYLSLILEGSRNRKIQVGQTGYLNASEGIIPLDVPQKVDRSMGDIHASGNPHYWLDPLNAKIIAANIEKRLSELYPENKSLYRSNLKNFNAEIDERLNNWMTKLAPYKGQKIITYHKTWLYFAKRFNLEIIGELEPKPGVPPSPYHLKNIVDLVNKNNIKIILNENIYKDDAANYVANQTGANVVVSPISVDGVKQAKDYISLMETIITEITKGFMS